MEDWWCPFAHDRKDDFAEGAIDRSFWHDDPDETLKLHPDDKDNPLWIEQGEASDGCRGDVVDRAAGCYLVSV